MDQELELYATEWVKMMWDMDVINHDAWDDGLEECTASLISYLRGIHHDSHQYAERVS